VKDSYTDPTQTRHTSRILVNARTFLVKLDFYSLPRSKKIMNKKNLHETSITQRDLGK